MKKQSQKKLWSYSGIFLIATGMIHTLIAIALGKETFLKIISE